MRHRTILASIVVVLASVAAAWATHPQMGTWQLNESKSKIPPGASKNLTVVYSIVGDSVKVVVDGVDKDGKPTHNEWTGKFDGKDYPVVGDPMSDTRAYETVNDRTVKIVGKKAGKETMTAKVEVAADGKTRKLTLNTTGTDGKKMKVTAVYDKQ